MPRHAVPLADTTGARALRQKDGKIRVMKNIATKRNAILVALIGALSGYAIIFPDQLGICYLMGDTTCHYSFPVFTLGEPLLNFSLCILVVTIALYFFRDEVFRACLRFAYWWIPFSVLVIFLTPTTNHAWAIGGPTREIISWLMGGLFVAISLFLIAIKSWQLRKKG